MLKSQEELESKVDTYTIGKDAAGHIAVVNYAFQEGRYEQFIFGSEAIIDLLADIEDHLPPFRIVLSPHDGPNRLSDYFVRDLTLRAAHDGACKYLPSNATLWALNLFLDVTKADFPQITRLGWRSACFPKSPARQKPFNLNHPPPRPEKKTFVYDHLRSMDPCLHPDLFHHHGQFLSQNEGPPPQAMVPEFSYCSTAIHHNIRIPTPYGWQEDVYPRSDDPAWNDKLDERLLWRGSSTGIFHGNKIRWQNSHRDFLVRYTNDLNGTLSVLRPTSNETEIVGSPKQYHKSKLNPALLDVAFSGKPTQCSPDTCDLLREIYPWRERQSVKDAGNYKYIVDVSQNPFVFAALLLTSNPRLTEMDGRGVSNDL